MASSRQAWVVLFLVLMNAYSFGANCVERFVNYETWPQLSKADFGSYHRAQQPYILAFIVAPTAVALLLQIALAFDRPQQIPAWIVIVMIGASIAGFLSTVTIQIPIHRQLDHGYSPQLVKRLLSTDWIRKIADVIRLAATIVLLRRSLS